MSVVRFLGIVILATMTLHCTAAWAAQQTPIRQPEYVPPGKVLTLSDCINLALKNQSSIRLAEAQIQSETGAVKEARSGLLPTTSISTSTEVAGSIGNSKAPITFSGNQLVYNFGRSPALLSQAEQQRSAGLSNLTGIAADVVLSVKQAYYTLLQDIHLVDVFTGNLKSQEAHVAEAQAREEAGVAPHTDVLTAQALAASAQFDLVTAQNTADQARINLNSAMGIDIRSPVQIAEGLEPEAPVPTTDQAVNLAIERRPEIRRDSDQILAAEANVKAALTGNLPDISATANYTPNPIGNGFGQQQSWALFLGLQWTPFDSGFTTGAIEVAKAQVLTAQETLYADRQSISAEVLQARLNVIAAQAQSVSAMAEVASAQANLDAAVGSYSAGIGIFLAIVDAQAVLLKAQVDEYSARYGLSIARAQLQHATGGATP